MPKSVILLGLLILAAAAPIALQTASSDDGVMFLIVVFGGPVFLIVAVTAISLAIRAIRSRAVTVRTLGIYSASVAFTSLAVFGGIWRWLHPANIHYEFGYGQSGGWQEVQFTHTEHGQEIKGPWVGGMPLRVRFPDVNHDGYPDIHVLSDYGGIVEYVYLPQNDGKHFWHLVRGWREGFAVDYPPDGQPYP